MVGIRPWHERGHAIVAATFGIEFAKPLPAAAVRELVALHPKFKDKYPRKRDLSGLEISLGSPGGEPAVREIVSASGGFLFDSLKADGTVERSIKLEGVRLSISRSDYTQWSDIWGEAQLALRPMLKVAMDHAGASNLHLQYHDRFLWDGDRTNFRPQMVFREGSNFLTPNVFKVGDLWHSFHGFFEYPTEPQPHQLLHVIQAQVTVTDEVGFAIDIIISHRAMPGATHGATIQGAPIHNFNELVGDDGGLLSTYMNRMHDKDKELLGQILNDDACRAIRLIK